MFPLKNWQNYERRQIVSLPNTSRGKLNLAVQLACQAERERRAGRRESAKQCQCQWEGVTAEVKRLLPMVRAIGVRLSAPEKPEQQCPRPKRR